MNLLQVTVFTFLVSLLIAVMTQMWADEYVEAQTAGELRNAATWIGERRAEWLMRKARLGAAALFGRQDEQEDVPEFRGPKLGSLRDLVPVVQLAIFRVLVMVVMVATIAPLIIAAIVDGVMIRLRKRENLQSENPRVYHLAKNALLGVLVGPAIIAVLPVQIGPVMTLIWAGFLVLTAWGMAQNVEQEV